jgi:hypothetical protein
MNRIRHFAANAGTWGVIRVLLVTAGVVALTAYSIHERDYLAPAFVALAPVATYFVRRWMTSHVDATKTLLNLVAVVFIACLLLFRGQIDVEVDWMRRAVVFVAAYYISCYFWLLSDPDVLAGPAYAKFVRLANESNRVHDDVDGLNRTRRATERTSR